MSQQQRQRNNFRAAFWNANGLAKNRNELVHFAERHTLDVIMVNETHLSANSRDPKMGGFTLYRKDRENGRGGGVAIYVKNSINHYPMELPELITLEATAISLVLDGGNIALVSCYLPSGKNLVETDFTAIRDCSQAVIAAGDFNAKHTDWGCRVATRSGHTLSRLLDQNQDIVLLAPDEPTHFPTRGVADILDIALLKNVRDSVSVEVIMELSSDHHPVLLLLGQQLEAQEDRINKTKTDWKKFQEVLNEDLGPIPTIDSEERLEEAVVKLEEKITTAVTNASKFFSEPRKSFQKLPAWIVDLIREKNRARRLAQRSRLQADRTEFNRLVTEVRWALMDFRSQKWDEKIESLSIEDHSAWEMVRKLKNPRKPLPPIHGAQGVAHTDEEKAQAFADSLELQCRTSLEHADLDFIDEVEDFVSNNLEDGNEEAIITPTSPSEIRDIIRKLKKRKAPGPDNVSNRALKNLPIKALVYITTIINAIFSFQHFPSRWKSANVIFLQKPGKSPKFPQNYRPISLLSAIGKIAERVIRNRLVESVTEHNLLPDEQFGFRSKHSTTDQILRVTEFFSVAINFKKIGGAIFLDVSKAFDTVWHEGLIYKLLHTNMSKPLVRLINSFLLERKFRARVRQTLSTERSLEAGVPQGSVLSPLLYSLFTRDIPKPPNSQIAVYADDTAILACSLSPVLMCRYLQEAATVIEEWFSRWLLKVNPDKSSGLFVTRRRKSPSTTIQMFGENINWERKVKYLGVIFDSRLSFIPHVDYVVSQAKGSMAVLFPLICPKSKLSIRNKCHLYKACVRSIMTYAIPAWAHVSKTRLKKLQVVQNKAIRRAFGAPWYVRNDQLHAESGIPSIRKFIKSLLIKYHARAKDHPNPLMRKAVDYNEDDETRHKRPKTALLMEVDWEPTP